MMPASVTPAEVTLRTASLPLSAMKTLPDGSTATPKGLFKRAPVAGPKSPLKPAVPVPAIVVMMPLVATLRTTLESRSAMKTLPAASMAMPMGKFSCARVAGPPSPELPARPLPAKRVRTPAAVDLEDRVQAGEVDVAGSIAGQASGVADGRAEGRRGRVRWCASGDR